MLFEFACYKNVYIIKKKYKNFNVYNDKSSIASQPCFCFLLERKGCLLCAEVNSSTPCSDSSNETVNITCQCISISTLII